jgi:type I restriction enzyme S subunit
MKSNLPTGWEWTTLGEIADWGSGGTPTAGNMSYYGGDIPWLIIGDLNDGYINSSAKTITQKGLENSNARMIVLP